MVFELSLNGNAPHYGVAGQLTYVDSDWIGTGSNVDRRWTGNRRTCRLCSRLKSMR
jgi:hypothetical protein